MSQAHRPTWAPAVGRESKIGSRTIFEQNWTQQTKLKVRQPGQGSTGEIVKRDLRAELARAERDAQNKKRKARGLPALMDEEAVNSDGKDVKLIETGEDEQARKRRKVLEEARDLDADDSDDEEEGDDAAAKKDRKGKGKQTDGNGDDEDEPMSKSGTNQDADDDDESSDESDSDSDEEDDTAALMAELNKIKQERAEEKERQERESASASALDRESEIATGNPLLNLQAALGQSTPARSVAGSSTTTGSFAVKRRWDDDLIFKNQAIGDDEKGKKKEFVNDLLRSEFHRKFMSKFIK